MSGGEGRRGKKKEGEGEQEVAISIMHMYKTVLGFVALLFH